MQRPWVILGSYESAKVHVQYEARAAGILGPQQACHEDAVEFSLLERGSEHAVVGGVRSDLQSGQYGLIGPGIVHSSWTTKRSALEYNIHLPVESLRQIAEHMGATWSTIRWPRGGFAAGPELLGIMQTIKHELAADPTNGQHLVMDSLAVSLAALLVRRHVLANGDPVEDLGSVTARLGRAEDLIRASLAEPPSLDELAEVSRMSRYHFLRTFKKHYGVPPFAYLNRLRIERAAEWIRSTDLPLTTIAFDLGFASSGRLTEAFKRIYGLPPSTWRCRQRGAISGKWSRNQREGAGS